MLKLPWVKYVVLSLLTGCTSRIDLAPIVEGRWKAQHNHPNTYIVQHKDTLYAIAFRYDLDYRQLAVINHLPFPYQLRLGQRLQLKGNKSNVPMPTPIIKNSNPIIRPQSPAKASKLHSNWLWPLQGRITTNFHPQLGSKGINIAGTKGQMIRAAASGVVAYSGNGLAGYGNLIIIKHNNQFLTAYGNNLRNLVHEGQTIKAGQAIAEIGMIDRKYWGVHFEIRQAGRPMDPLAHLN